MNARAAAACLVAAALSLSPSASRAESEPAAKKACARQSEAAQQLRTEKKLRRAREGFISCAQDQCPKAVRDDCHQWLSEVEKEMPSVVVSVRDAKGRDLAVKRVLVDGETFAEKLDGSAVSIDPGTHRFRAELADGRVVARDVLIAEGEKSRAVTLATEAERARPPVSAWVLGSISVVAFGSFAYFGLSGRAEATERRETCGPNCPTSDLDAIRRKLVIADVSLGVGLVTLGAAAWIVLRSPSPGATTTAVGLRPLPGGGYAALQATF